MGLDPEFRSPERKSLSHKLVVKVTPVGVTALNQIELPCPMPPLQALFVRDTRRNRFAALGPYQTAKLMAGTEI
jgi:hypothetical protein